MINVLEPLSRRLLLEPRAQTRIVCGAGAVSFIGSRIVARSGAKSMSSGRYL
jgi:hypothetical protein